MKIQQQIKLKSTQKLASNNKSICGLFNISVCLTFYSLQSAPLLAPRSLLQYKHRVPFFKNFLILFFYKSCYAI